VGVLRLFDRFNLLAAQAVVSPAVGLAGACIAWATGGGLAAFLVVWFLAAAADGVSLVALGWRELARQGLLRGMDASLRGLARPHPGIWRFVWAANIHTSLSAASSHLVTLLIGWLLGPAAAGLFKVASQFAGVLVVPGTLLKRSIYPELARLAARGGAATVRRVMLRAGMLAGSAAVLAVVLLALLGEPLLRLIVGDAFVGAYGVLILIAAANAVAIYGVALDPVFFAIGRPGVMLRVSALTIPLNFVLLFVLAAEYGLIGAGLAALASTAVGVAILTTLALGRLARLAPGDLQAPAIPANKGA
jgi:O-antigen/teichoic acid export membrane protein